MKSVFLCVLTLISTIANAVDFWPAACLKTISIGQTVNGDISTTNDCNYNAGDSAYKWYVDVYTFSGTAGQQIAVAMNGAGGFDPFLHLYFGNTAELANRIGFDNDGGGGINARIPASTGYVTLPSSGTYFVWAAANRANTNGMYSLTLSSPLWSLPPLSDLTVTEFYHPQFNHYFITAYPDEAASLAAGRLPPWTPTGQTFPVWKSAGNNIANVCRFFSSTFSPKSSHFYTHNPAECQSLRNGNVWQLEATEAFSVMPTTDGACPTNTMPLYRLYNNGMSGAPNHRYTSSLGIRGQMIAAGWIPEGYGANSVFACIPIF